MMELLYIWVDNYKNIKKQGFNFSPKYRFDYNDNEKELTITENLNHIPKFFPEGISNVTAIVGENGAGKSTLLEFIKSKSWFTYSPAHYNDVNGDIVVIRERNSEKIILYVHEENKNVKLKNESNINIKEEELPQNGIFFIPIFYSIFYDLYDSEAKKIRDGVDISTNHLIRENNKSGVAYYSEYIYKHYPQTEVFDFLECIKQIKFATSNFRDKVKNIKVPDNASFSIRAVRYTDKKEEYKNLSNDINMKYIRVRERFEKEYENKKNSNDTTIILYANTIYQLYHLLLYVLNFINNIHNSTYPFKTYNKKNLNRGKLALKRLRLKFRRLSLKNKIKNFLKSFDLQGLDELVGFIEDSIENDMSSNAKNIVLDLDKCKKILEIDKKLSKELNQKFNQKGAEILIPYFTFYWNELSSGEYALFSLFARFYELLTELQSKENILILIDEGELGMHPQWQKQYLKSLIDVLPKIFEGKQLQIILTSHSPFLVSDLPNENIIFLEKDEKTGNCVVKNSLNDMKHTFGANIHTLLTDSFFMKGGLMGDFAKKKINEVIKFLNNEESEITDIEIAQKYIRAIGEPIIRNQLQKMLDSKRLSKVDEIAQKLNNLQNDLNQFNKL